MRSGKRKEKARCRGSRKKGAGGEKFEVGGGKRKAMIKKQGLGSGVWGAENRNQEAGSRKQRAEVGSKERRVSRGKQEVESEKLEAQSAKRESRKGREGSRK